MVTAYPVGLRRALLSGALLAALAFALSAPATAFAGVATFSARTPGSGAKLLSSPKTISITVRDKYGVRGSGAWVMKVDGKKVKPKATYLTKYSVLRLTYTVPRALSAKAHKVTVTVHDRKHHTSTSSWSFSVLPPYSAAFATPLPANGSSSADARPTLSIHVTDRYGVKSSAATMTLDGAPVGAVVDYDSAGVSTACTVNWTAPVDLEPGLHTVAVRVADTLGHVSTYSWSFTVLALDLSTVDMPVTGTGCTDCHVGYPAHHPMTDCAGCHAAGSPQRPVGSLYPGQAMNDYPSTWPAHTAACALNCHGHAPNRPNPHVLDSACTRCHSANYPKIPAPHAIDPAAISRAHVSTSAFCTRAGCHISSLTMEHYRWTTAAGERLSCATCHASNDPKVAASILSHSTACEGCHDFAGSEHPDTATAHTATGGCVRTGCHTPNVAVLHEGKCGACHSAPISDTACAGCHSSADHTTLHVTTADAACASCHPTSNLTGIHPTCDTCHESNDPAVVAAIATHKLTCSACHAGLDHIGRHAVIAPVECGGCHDQGNLTTIHRACATCHNSKDPAVVTAIAARDKRCIACHPGGLPLSHRSHTATVSTCTVTIGATSYGTHACSECHRSTDLMTAHGGSTGCMTCHPGAAEAASPWNGGCTQGACHADSSTRPMHATITAAHSVSLETTLGCTAPGCHAGGLSVAAIHDHTAAGCATCHDTNRIPTNECSTVGCHSASDTHPASAPHPGMTTKHTTGLPDACVKAGCHAGDLSGLHAAATDGLGCRRCHSEGHSPILGCTASGCHSASVPSAVLHPDYLSRHQTAAAGCTTVGCHSTDVIALHTSGSTPPGCAACHAAGKPRLTTDCATAGCHADIAPPPHFDHTATVATGTITIRGVAYAGQRCTLCHGAKLDLLVIHAGANGCASCHPGPAETAKPWNRSCAQGSCHSVATGGIHASVDASHSAPDAASCLGSCHVGGSDAAAIHAAVAGRGDSGCGICHGGGAVPTLACDTEECHSAVFKALSGHAGYPTAHSLPTAPSCIAAGCHEGGTDAAAIHASVNGRGDSGCGICHTSGDAPSLTCDAQGCHREIFANVSSHAGFSAGHALQHAPACSGSDCHEGGTDIIAIHAKPGCVACHADGRPALTLTCETPGCHGPADPHPTAAPHPNLVSSHTTGLPETCAKPGCHVTDLVALHASAHGCATCHGAGTKPAATCTISGCHPAIVSAAKHRAYATAHALATPSPCAGSDCHDAGTDVAVMHAKPGCAACHAADKPELSLSCETPGCHGPGDGHPAGAPHPNMAASHATGLLPACVDSGCHTPDLVALHAKAHGCPTCHGTGKTPSGNCAATGCHPANGSAMHQAHTATVTSASFRINNLNYGTYECSLCHDSTDLIAVHGGRGSCPTCHPGPADGAKPWNGGCDQNGCHSATSAHPMHAKLQTAHLTTVQPKCTIDGCHFGNSSVGGRDAILVHFAKLKCATCHGGGKTPTLDCIACHPQAATGDHQVDHTSCNDCHQPYVWDRATSTANTGANLGTGAVSGINWPMSDATWTVLIGRATIRPGYPHGDYTQLVFPGPIGAPGPYTSLPYPAGNTGTYTCATCHTGTGVTWVHPGSDYFTCGSGGDCHQHHGNWDPAENSETYVHNTPPASWTQIMKW